MEALNDQLVALQKEIMYSSAVKSKTAGLAQGLVYQEVMPVGSNKSAVNGSSFIFNLTSDSFWDTSRSEILYDIAITGIGADPETFYYEGASAPFKSVILRALNNSTELCRINSFNKLDACMARARINTFGNSSAEGRATQTGAMLSKVVKGGADFAGLTITPNYADGEYVATANTHRAFTAAANSKSFAMGLRGMSAASLTSGEHAKFFPLFMAPLQLELQLENTINPLVYGAVANAGLTAEISNIRLKMCLINYDQSFLNSMKQMAMKSGGLVISVPRWNVSNFTNNTGAISYQMGIVASSLRSVIVLNDVVANNTTAHASLSTSPSLSANSFYIQINGNQFPNRSLTEPVQQYEYANDAVGGFGTCQSITKYKSAITAGAALTAGTAAYTDAAPALNILGIDLEANGASVGTLGGKPTGVGITVNIGRSVEDNRNYYICCLYDTIMSINPADGTISVVA